MKETAAPAQTSVPANEGVSQDDDLFSDDNDNLFSDEDDDGPDIFSISKSTEPLKTAPASHADTPEPVPAPPPAQSTTQTSQQQISVAPAAVMPIVVHITEGSAGFTCSEDLIVSATQPGKPANLAGVLPVRYGCFVLVSIPP